MRFIRVFIFTCLFWCWSYTQGYSQVLADFTFDDTSDMPASLKRNAVPGGTDAIYINPNARSDGDGVYTQSNEAGQALAIDLQVAEETLNHTESVYLEFDFQPQEGDDFSWLIFSGYVQDLDLFRLGYANYPDRPHQQGFHVRYGTKEDTSSLITSGYVGGPLQRGERAIIGFGYDTPTGTAYIKKNNETIWQTPEAQRTPGMAFHWKTANGYFTIGANMNENGSTTPSLYRFRAFNKLCAPLLPLNLQGDTICASAKATLKAVGADNGQYRWYRGEEGDLTLIDGAFDSIFVTPSLNQSTTYYVSVMGEFCESEAVPVEAIVLQEPKIPNVRFIPVCGSGIVNLYLEDQQEDMDYFWSSANGQTVIKQNDSLEITVFQDSLVYVWAGNGICESAHLPVPIFLPVSPSINAGQDRRILAGESTELTASGDFVECEWSGGDIPGETNTTSIMVSPQFTQKFIVTTINENGCSQSDTVTVFVINKFPVPNAFSPNQDGLNDTWEIPNIDKFPSCRIAVFNRWGNEVFSSAGYTSPWDGTQNGQPLPFGTYYYSLQLSPEHKVIKGTVLTVR